MLSKVSYLCCAIVMMYCCFGFYPKWHEQNGEAAIGWDVSGYYWYLPSVVIYKDLKYQRFADCILQKYHPTPEIQQFNRYPDSSCVMTYSSGMAFIYLPLFTAAHLLAKPLGYPADGFSAPYQFALQVGSLLFAIIGLWYFRKLLKLYFDDGITAMLLLLLVIGTNYLNYASIDGPMTHSWLFGLYTLLLLNTYNFYKTPSVKYAVRIGLLIGLQILIRPSEMVAILIPLLWGMESISATAIKQKVSFYQQHYKKLLIAVLCVLAIGSIQLMYWKYASGHWLVYSYGKDKGFTWLPPHLINYVFSGRSGWLMYCPLMLFAFIGLLPFIYRGQNKIAILAFIACNLYVVSAWDVWWYGGRAMIQSYPVLFFPLGSLVQYMKEKKLAAWLLAPFMLLFIYINIWFTIQAHKGTGVYDVDNMTRAYYWRIIGRWHPDNMEQLEKLKDTDELFEGQPHDMQTVYTHDFETDTIKNPEPAIQGKVSDYVGPNREYSTSLVFNIPDHRAQWLRVQGTFRCVTREWTGWEMPQLVVKFVNKNGLVKSNAVRPHHFLFDGATKDAFIDVKIPAASFDSVKVFCWNPGSKQTLVIDNIKAATFHE